MFLKPVWQALEGSAVGGYVASSEWAFPMLESVHVIALVTVVGTVAVMDLRLLGLASKDSAVTQLSRDTLPYTWGAFVLAFITGSLLFVSKATAYMVNPWFLWKIGFLVLAGLNMAVFHVFTWKTVKTWDNDADVPTGGKIAGALSLLFWLAVIFCGRLIGFTLGIYQA